MKSLYQIILESTTKFEYYVSDFEDLLKKCKSLKAIQHKELLNDFLNDVISDADYKPTELFIYAPGASYFKIPYAFSDAIKQNINGKYAKQLKFTESGKKIKVYLAGAKGLLFETGSGSIGRVSTAHQEQATCIIWNTYVDFMIENKEFNINDPKFIRNLVSDLTPDFDSEWISTFAKQIICIQTYLKSIDVDPLHYKMCRYGSAEGIGDVYQKYIDAYTKEMGGGGKKDNFDPADVIVYRVADIGESRSALSSYCNNPVDSKEKYINELFNTHMLKGLSLKKIRGNQKEAKYDIYNVMDYQKIGNVTGFSDPINKNTTNQITIECKGNFNFDTITDEKGETVGQEKIVRLTMRSFGSGQTGIDCELREHKGASPALGKCPARFWREILSCKQKYSLEQNIECFKQFLNGKNKTIILEGLKNIIKGAIKEGPSCFPFILIH